MKTTPDERQGLRIICDTNRWPNLFEVADVCRRLLDDFEMLERERDEADDPLTRLREFQRTYCEFVEIPGVGKFAVPPAVARHMRRLSEAADAGDHWE